MSFRLPSTGRGFSSRPASKWACTRRAEAPVRILAPTVVRCQAADYSSRTQTKVQAPTKERQQVEQFDADDSVAYSSRDEGKFVHPRHAVQLNAADMKRTVQAVILAGGNSSNPLAKHRALAAVPIGANTRLIDISIANCLQSNINKIYVLTQFNSHTLNTHINTKYPPMPFEGRGREGWVDVLTAIQTPQSKEWFRGSADAVRRMLPTLLDQTRGIELPEDIVVLSGESMYNMDFSTLVREHRENDNDITVATTCVSMEDARELGVLKIHPQSGDVMAFVEKPHGSGLEAMKRASPFSSEERPYEASMGVYVFKRAVLADLLEAKPGRTAINDHFGRDIIPIAVTEGYQVSTWHHNGYWKRVATLQDYIDLNLSLTMEDSPISLFNVDNNLMGRGSMLPPSRMHNADLNEVLIGEGCLIQDSKISRSVLGQNTVISPGCELDRCLLLGNEFFTNMQTHVEMEAQGLHPLGVGSNTKMREVVVDFNASIGRDCQLLNQDRVLEADRTADGYVIQDGVVVVMKGAVIPNGTII